MDTTQNTELPDFAPSFTRLADALGVDRGNLRGIRERDRRFPKPTTDGEWPVIRVGLLLELRRVERMTDADYAAELRDHARATLARIEAGHCDHLDPDGWPVVMLRRFRALLETNINGSRGAATRDEFTDDLLEGIERTQHTNQPGIRHKQ